MRFDGRVAVVTGAGNGLGRTYAAALAARGASVVVNDLGVSSDGTEAGKPVADAVVEEIRTGGGSAVASVESVATTEGADAIVETAIATFGRVDVVVNNAGILRDGAIEDLTDADFDSVISTHLRGAFAVSRAAFPSMRAQGYGRFVFTSSGAGVFGRGWQATYSAAKAGMVGLSNAVAIEGAAHGIRSNVVLPVALTRLAEAPRPEGAAAEDYLDRPEMAAVFARMAPEFVTPLVVYLASEACAVSQEAFSSLGGRYARVLFGVTSGWQCLDAEPPAPEAIAAHLVEIEDRAEYDLPRSVTEEMFLAARRAAGARPD